MGFPRQEYWSGLPFPSPGDFLDPGIEPGSPALRADALPSEPQGSLKCPYVWPICWPLFGSAFISFGGLRFCESAMISSTSADQFPFSDNDYFQGSTEKSMPFFSFSFSNVLSWKRIFSPHFWSKVSFFHMFSKLSWRLQVLEHKKIFLSSTLSHLSFPSVHKELIPCWKKRKDGNSGREKVQWDNRF